MSSRSAASTTFHILERSAIWQECHRRYFWQFADVPEQGRGWWRGRIAEVWALRWVEPAMSMVLPILRARAREIASSLRARGVRPAFRRLLSAAERDWELAHVHSLALVRGEHAGATRGILEIYRAATRGNASKPHIDVDWEDLLASLYDATIWQQVRDEGDRTLIEPTRGFAHKHRVMSGFGPAFALRTQWPRFTTIHFAPASTAATAVARARAHLFEAITLATYMGGSVMDEREVEVASSKVILLPDQDELVIGATTRSHREYLAAETTVRAELADAETTLSSSANPDDLARAFLVTADTSKCEMCPFGRHCTGALRTPREGRGSSRAGSVTERDDRKEYKTFPKKLSNHV